MFLGLFAGKKPQGPQPKSQSDPEQKELKAIWESLDQKLKNFAKETHDLGLGGLPSNKLKVRFNERGMSELVRQLDKIGYEIKPKEDHEDEQ